MNRRAPRWLRRRLLPVHQDLERRLHELCYLFFEITQRCNLACLPALRQRLHS